eukprot:jgi/Chlat1/1827/Chrsp138S02144
MAQSTTAAAAAVVRRAAAAAASDVWKPGKYAVVWTNLAEASTAQTRAQSPPSTLSQPQSSGTANSAVLPPKPLLIASPKSSSSEAHGVVLFVHGFIMLNSYYSTLIEHIASHGYIVVAPQCYTLSVSASCVDELRALSHVLDWLPDNLAAFLASSTPDLRKLVLAGHSRGGKVAHALALGLESTFQLKVSGLIGFDPVDGDKSCVPRVTESSFGFPFSTLLIGSGLGDKGRVPCAPAQTSHNAFFNACTSRVYRFIGEGAGHMDFLDTHIPKLPLINWLATHVCAPHRHHDRTPMRTFAAGVAVAYLRSIFDIGSTVLEDIVAKLDSVPDIKVTAQVKS